MESLRNPAEEDGNDRNQVGDDYADCWTRPLSSAARTKLPAPTPSAMVYYDPLSVTPTTPASARITATNSALYNGYSTIGVGEAQRCAQRPRTARITKRTPHCRNLWESDEYYTCEPVKTRSVEWVVGGTANPMSTVKMGIVEHSCQ